MSTLIVKISKIDKVLPHPNADLLDVASIGAWDTVVKKGVFVCDDLVVYVPPDSILPSRLHTFLGVTKYLGEMPADSQERAEGAMRVRATRLRGEKSFGLVISMDEFIKYCEENSIEFPPLVEGTDIAAVLSITKYPPAERGLQGDAAPPISWFHVYTDIENYRNFPSLIPEGTPVVCLEKAHGQNFRGGYCVSPDKLGEFDYMAGSHTTQRKEFDIKGNVSHFWKPMTQGVRDMLKYIAVNKSLYREEKTYSVIIYGEIIGEKIQDMTYGVTGTTMKVFDIAVNNHYMDWDRVIDLCHYFSIDTVPELGRGLFSRELIEQYTDGPTTICPPDQLKCRFKGREGTVIKSLKEGVDKKGNRLIIKSVSCEYLSRANATDNA